MLQDVQHTSARIEAGEKLIIAGDANLIEQLPPGNWIAGTIPYFVDEGVGQTSKSKLLSSPIPRYAEDFKTTTYTVDTIQNIAADAPPHGMSIVIIPYGCETHFKYAKHAQDFEDMYSKPIMGWISGIHLDDLGKQCPKVYDGSTLEHESNKAVVAHITLPQNKSAEICTCNPYEQGTGNSIQFQQSGFSAKTCTINGVEVDLADYIKTNHISTRFPLVSDYDGKPINVSIQNVDSQNGVDFYAPVFTGINYRFAKQVSDLTSVIFNEIKTISQHSVFSCNCVLNYLYGGLESTHVPGPSGPVTFGEIAYQLLNQTMVYAKIIDK